MSGLERPKTRKKNHSPGKYNEDSKFNKMKNEYLSKGKTSK